MMRNKPEINFLISLIIFVIIEIMILGTDHIIGIVVVTSIIIVIGLFTKGMYETK